MRYAYYSYSRERLSAARHEGAHALVRVLRGGRVARLEIYPQGGGRMWPGGEQLSYDAQIAVLLAGALAEFIFEGSIGQGCDQDIDEAFRVATRFYGAGAQAVVWRIARSVHEDITTYRAAVHALASRLCDERRLIDPDVRDVLYDYSPKLRERDEPFLPPRLRYAA